MNKDINTTAADINMLLSKKGGIAADGSTIISAKINPITSEKELDLISGSGAGWGQAYVQVWGQITF